MSETYFGNVLTAFENGVQLDLRVKLAVDFLKAPHLIDACAPADQAAHALQLADELLSQAQAAGWVKDLPDTDGLPAAARRHFTRMARAQVLQQLAGQKIGQEEMDSQIQRAPGTLINGRT